MLMTIKRALQLPSETFLIPRSERDVIKSVHRSSRKAAVIARFYRNWNFRDMFNKYLKINFHENPSSGSRLVPCGQPGRRTDVQAT